MSDLVRASFNAIITEIHKIETGKCIFIRVVQKGVEVEVLQHIRAIVGKIEVKTANLVNTVSMVT